MAYDRVLHRSRGVAAAGGCAVVALCMAAVAAAGIVPRSGTSGALAALALLAAGIASLVAVVLAWKVVRTDRRSLSELMRADQLAMVGQVAAGVAHELRNPLTSVKMLVQTNLREARARGLPAEDLNIIEQEIRRMERCLQQFLDFARPPAPERRAVDLALLVERTLALVEGRARKEQVALEFERPPRPVLVEVDADQIQQLLVNLVLNALDAIAGGGPGGGSARVEVSLRAREDTVAEVQVADTGPGIAAELFPRLFDPFVSTKERGIGLGLAVSHRIAETHAGTLSAFNPPAGGACFVLRLPLAAAAGRAPRAQGDARSVVAAAAGDR